MSASSGEKTLYQVTSRTTSIYWFNSYEVNSPNKIEHNRRCNNTVCQQVQESKHF